MGDSRRELADLRLAEGLSRDAPAAVRDNLLFLLGRAERASGRMQDAIRYYVERIGYARNGKTRAARMLDTAFLEVVYGDITGAAARRDEARFLLTASLGDPSSWSQKDPTTAAKFNKVSADLLLARGALPGGCRSVCDRAGGDRVGPGGPPRSVCAKRPFAVCGGPVAARSNRRGGIRSPQELTQLPL